MQLQHHLMLFRHVRVVAPTAGALLLRPTEAFHRFLIALPLLAALACARQTATPAVNNDTPPSHYLFAWTGDEDRADSDFLTVIDLTPSGGRYGTIVATTPVGEKALWPHHTEHELGASHLLFANGFSSNRTMLFDLHDALHPKVVERFTGGGDLTFLHSFTRLPNGHTLATFQAHGDSNVSPGGIAELDEAGRVVQSRSAADASADQTTLRPYGLAVVPALDRIVVALTYMPIPTWHPLRPSIEHDHSGNQVQVYRLSDLTLIKTIKLPTADGPNEPRVLADGRTVLVNTGECRLYQVTGLDGTNPQLEMIHEELPRGCAMPVVIGNYWIQANASNHTVFSLDIRDLGNVRRVSVVSFDTLQRPHWLATDGARIVVVNEPSPAAERRVWMLRVKPSTGQLALDSAFRDVGSSRPGITFNRPNSPHGATGNAVPHATVFGR